MPDWIGRTLSKVELRERLGRGAMAEVYRGQHLTLNRPVAVKRLNTRLAADAHAQARFRAEAQAVAALRHANIVQVFDFDVADDQPYIVMELVPGLPLDDYLRQAPRLPPETVARLTLGLAAALDYAHARGLIHRDVKPANILLRREGGINPAEPLPTDTEIVLSDFGVARFAALETLSGPGTISGTPTYLSPEQAQGAPLDARADVYSLGIVVYEMLAGQPPFGGPNENLISLIFKHLTAPPPPIPDTSEAVQMVVRRALAKAPADRYPHAGDFATALLAAIFGAALPPSAAGALPFEGLLHALARLVEQARAYERALPPDNFPARAVVATLGDLARNAQAEARNLVETLQPAPAAKPHPFSPREFDVLALAAQGLTNKEIACRLGVSDRTVQFHLNSVFNKTGAASRTEAVALALQQRWLA
jgi:serine/threonine-protein kinase